LRNEENAGEGHGGGDEGAPADLGAVVFAEEGTENPGAPEDECADEVGVVIVGREYRQGKVAASLR